MPYLCVNHGVCPDSELECEECRHNSEDNKIHWIDPRTDDGKAVIPIFRKLYSNVRQLTEENEALRLLLRWAEESGFGYDQFPEEYEKYKDKIEGLDYIEGMIKIAKLVIEEKGDVV